MHSRRCWPVVLAALWLCGCGDDEQMAGGDRGRELFAARCGGCHTLSAAGTHGSPADPNRRRPTDGPNLDRRRISYDDALFAIRNGGFSGTRMPENIVTGEDAEAVARFVARNAGADAAAAPGSGIEAP